MPVNDIIATLASEVRPETGGSGNEPPTDDNAPDPSEGQETNMRTGQMLPPYVHIQTVEDRSNTLWNRYGEVAFAVSLAYMLYRTLRQ
jgi:hypothetical protein